MNGSLRTTSPEAEKSPVGRQVDTDFSADHSRVVREDAHLVTPGTVRDFRPQRLMMQCPPWLRPIRSEKFADRLSRLGKDTDGAFFDIANHFVNVDSHHGVQSRQDILVVNRTILGVPGLLIRRSDDLSHPHAAAGQ